MICVCLGCTKEDILESFRIKKTYGKHNIKDERRT